MSWITDLADKAEGILNKIDQNTAALTTPIADNGISTTLDVMRKSLSNSTNSLKTTLSPAKQRIKYATSDKNVTLATDSELIAINIDVPETPPAAVAFNSNYELSESVLISQNSTPSSEAFASEPYDHDAGQQPNTTESISRNDYNENEMLPQRIRELEVMNKQLITERDNFVEQLAELQTTVNTVTHSFSELEANYAKLYQQHTQLQSKLQMQQDETEKSRQELQEYRSKAQRTLHMKDSLIAELKVANAIDTNINTSESESRCLQIEFNNLKQEYKQEQEANKKLFEQINALNNSLKTLRDEHEEILKQKQITEDHMNKQLRFERERNVVLESEQRMLTQDINALKQQFNEQLNIATARLQQKQQELENTQQAHGIKYSANEAKSVVQEYDERMRNLTKTLVEKQTTIERLTSDSNALRIQLEKIQQQLQNSVKDERLLQQNKQNALLYNTAERDTAEFPLLVKPSPFDNRVARRVKRAYSSVDSAGIRLGIFLRRYPLMRIVVLAYVLLLHIWVMFVMIWSTPN